MILGAPASTAAPPTEAASRLTIDGVLSSHTERHPTTLALVDAANRASFTDGEPRRLTFVEADRMVAAIATRLRGMGLPPDAIVGVQLPNIVENILAMLGILRAGMIVAPLPLLWRRADAVSALARLGAKALITCSRVGAFDQCQFATHVAAEVFSIRYVCAFGKNLPDGVVSFEDLFTADKLDPVPPFDRERDSHAAAHVAAVTFDVGEGGLVPVARNHIELFAAGLAVVLESRLGPDARILSALAASSFAGISLTLLPWLFSGGTLVLHHPFDATIFASQSREDCCNILILPATVALHLAEAGVFAVNPPTCVIATWRTPERLATSPVWREPNTGFVDVPVFGEAALAPARRGNGGRPSPIPFGPVMAPRGSRDGTLVAELTRTDAGTLAARGPMVPHHVFPPGIERSGLPYFQVGRDGLVDTFYPCRVDSGGSAMLVTGPPPDSVSVGGCRFALRDIQDLAVRIDSGATLAALPDALLGQRLIGNAGDRDKLQAALNAAGVNPLIAAAFRHCSEQGVAAAGAA
jgi:hypothetical protein